MARVKWGDFERIDDDRWMAHFTEQKTGKDRYVQIGDTSIRAIKFYFNEIFGRDPKDGEALFWTTPDGPPRGKRNPLTCYSTCKSRMIEIRKQATKRGIIEDTFHLTIHSWRHVAITRTHEFTKDVVATKRWSGHASMSNLDRYIHVNADQKADIARNIDNMTSTGQG